MSKKRLLIAGVLVALMIAPQASVWADGLTSAQRDEVRKLVQELSGPGQGTAPPVAPGQSVGLGDTSKRAVRFGTDFSGGSTLQGGRTIYAKPFVKAPKTIVGGYIDFTISDCNGGSQDCSRGLEFDQERFVPFFYSQVTDQLSVAVELEVEHGGPQSNQSDGDVKIEFATMDYRINDLVNLRGGIILIPMGRFNLIHDSPLNDLPLRPMVARRVLPSTFAESGVGIFGTFYPTDLSKVDYEFYITQGFDGDDTQVNSRITEANGMRSVRGSLKTDNNENKAIVSRVSVSPILGVEVAGSVHHGKWDDNSKFDVTLMAIDGNLQRGAFEVQGEAAWANVEGGTKDAVASPPSRMSGYYVQLNYHFLPEALKKMAPTHFTDASTFTGVIRWGEMDTNTNESANKWDVDRLTLGVNYRPTEDSAIKIAYTFNDHNGFAVGPDSSPGQANGWQFNLSSYF